MADLYSLFDDVSQRRTEEALERFAQHDCKAGEVIVEEGEVNDAMLLIEKGEVTVIAGGFEVARMGPGQIIGEIGLFTHAVRTATVKASSDCVLQMLSRRSFIELRLSGNPVAFRIERRAAEQLAGRFRALVADVVEVARRSPTMLLPPRMKAEYSGHPVQLTPTRLFQALQAASAFATLEVPSLELLSSTMEARTFGAGETLAGEARDDGPLFLLAHGQVDCIAPVGKGHSVRVATLDPGEVFNLVQHVDGNLRPVAYIAREGVSVLAMPQEAVLKYLWGNHLPGSALRIAMIRSLSDRVNQANATYSLAKLMTPEG
ncbi:MAG: cyclic nucleotide-binding domain-containing protein [Alphaproteobacteria bacterium]|nr:cyclic nucleotide-binding domain-containing protein [Alphaproteobacteria bacterium]